MRCCIDSHDQVGLISNAVGLSPWSSGKDNACGDAYFLVLGVTYLRLAAHAILPVPSCVQCCRRLAY